MITDWTEPAAAAYRAGRAVALLFDYDGTLTPIVRHPSLAVLPAAARDRLAALAALPDVAVGVVSGRALADVRGLVGLPRLFYAGSGGLELDLQGEPATYPGAAAFARRRDHLLAALRPVLAAHPGAWAEPKPVALSVHLRGLAPAAAVRCRLAVEAVLASHPDVRFREVSAAVEVTPVGGWDKGTAAEAVLARCPAGTFPVFVGDAPNDAEGMAVVAAVGGLTVGVGPDAPAAAAVRVAGPEAVAAGLDRLARELPPVRGRAPRAFAPAPVDRPPAAPAAGPLAVVVDPDPESRAASAAGLTAAGWRVRAVGEPAAGADAARADPSAVRAVFVDLQVPGLGGAKALAEFGRLTPGAVRCATAAGLPPYAAAAYRRLSATPLLAKPLRAEDVTAELRRHVAPPSDEAPQ